MFLYINIDETFEIMKKKKKKKKKKKLKKKKKKKKTKKQINYFFGKKNHFCVTMNKKIYIN